MTTILQGIYLTVIMATTSLSIVLTVLVLHIHHIGPNHKSIPPQIRNLFFDNLAPFLGMTTVRRYKLRKRNNESINRGQFPMSYANKFSSKELLSADKPPNNIVKSNSQSTSTPHLLCDKADFNLSKLNMCDCINSNSDNSTDHLVVENKSNDYFNTFSCSSTPPMKEDPQKGEFRRGLEENTIHDNHSLGQNTINQYSEIINHLHHLIEKQQEDELDQEMMIEWKVMAYVLDRCLFWIFAAVAGSATIIILLIMPLFK